MDLPMSWTSALSAILLGALLLLPPQLQAQGWVITGTVADALGSPIPQADLDLFNDLAPSVEILVSGDTAGPDGTFSMTILEAVPAGTFSLQVDPPPGFLSTTSHSPSPEIWMWESSTSAVAGSSAESSTTPTAIP